jgi:hypothetical protein
MCNTGLHRGVETGCSDRIRQLFQAVEADHKRVVHALVAEQLL